MKLFEIQWMDGTTSIRFANRRLEIWNAFPAGSIYCISEVVVL